mmetsp:Transcript_10420/g.23559  ORF Transcript_10420/g.23559 Transcript_10420/m.23559 type:complete len:288 (-) Transcript_10420:136-999(-)
MTKPGVRFCRFTSGSDGVPMTSSTSIPSSSEAAKWRSSDANRPIPSGPAKPASGGGIASWPAATGGSSSCTAENSSAFSSSSLGWVASAVGRFAAWPLAGGTAQTSGWVSQPSSSTSASSTPGSSGKPCRIAAMAALSSLAATGPNTSPTPSSCAAATSWACLSLIVMSSIRATYFKPRPSGSTPLTSKFCSKDAPRKAFKAASCRAFRFTRGEARSEDVAAAARCAAPYASTIFNCVSHTSLRKSCDLRLKILQAPSSRCPAERKLTAWENFAATCASNSLRFAST